MCNVNSPFMSIELVKTVRTYFLLWIRSLGLHS